MVTVEIEHVGVETLQELEAEGVNVQPSGRVLGIIRDKYLQKEHFQSHGVPLPRFLATPSKEAIQKAAEVLGVPLMLKARTGGYDGRGNAVLKSSADADVEKVLEQLGCKDADDNELDLYAEGWIDFDCSRLRQIPSDDTQRGAIERYSCSGPVHSPPNIGRSRWRYSKCEIFYQLRRVPMIFENVKH